MSTELLLPPPPEPQRILVAYNPVSSHAERTINAIDDLRARGWNVDEVSTDVSQDITNQRIADAAGPEHALIASGGDGTANLILNALYAMRLHRNYLAVNPAGNANDMWRNLHGGASLIETLQGRPMAAYALRTAVEYPDGETCIKYAAGYAGIGGAGRGSRWLNDVKLLPGHKAWEPLAVWLAVGRHPYFMLEPDTETDTEPTPHRVVDPVEVTDFSVGKADVMAKYGHTGADVFSPDALAFYSRQRGMAAALLRMLRLKNGTLAGEPLVADMSFVVRARSPRTRLTMYHDGEPLEVPDGSKLTFGIAPQPYWTLRHQPPVSQRAGEPVS